MSNPSTPPQKKLRCDILTDAWISPGTFADGDLAIYIRTIDEQMQFYTSRGRWRAARPSEVNLALKESLPLEFLAPILPYFPTSAVEMAALPQFALEGGVPRPLGEPLMSRMVEFEDQCRVFYGKHAEILDDIYAHISNENQHSVKTLEEIAKQALGVEAESLTKPAKLAIHKALQRQPFYIIRNSTPSATESYRIRARSQSSSIDSVVTWVRTYQNEHAKGASGRSAHKHSSYFGDFVARARRLVIQSRQSRQPTPSFSLGPASKTKPDVQVPDATSGTKVTSETWSASDRFILGFMLLWVIPPLNMTSGTHQSTGSMILRNIGLYGDYPLTPATGYLFLQEIGLLAPWENIHLLSEQLELPGHGFLNNSDRLAELCQEVSKKIGSDGFVDSMRYSRKDWGDLPVFCIDSVNASEIDDGISIERAVGKPADAYWIRVHVANPSAFIPTSHPFAKAAANSKQSFYTPEHVYSMLPSTVTHANFSLAPGRPTITFSAKVNMNGDILETEVANGRVNNVVHITPETVQKFFGIDHDHAPLVDLVVGRKPAEPSRPEIQDTIPKEHQESFGILQRLLAARRDIRVKKGAQDMQNYPKPMPIVSMPKKASPLWYAGQRGSRHHTRDPAIRLSGRLLDPYQTTETTKADIVSHAMLLAGEIAARWCKEREIPAIFSASSYRGEDPSVRPKNEEGGSPSDLGSLPLAFATSRPAPHAALGMDQYVKCTSPLRRYSDILAHWQIEAYIRLRKSKCLPFTEKQIDEHITNANWQVHLMQRAQNRAREFWACQLLNRALNFGATELPETFRCLVVAELGASTGGRSDDRKFIGSMLPFRLRCLLETSKETGSLQRGDMVDVKLSSVDVYDTLITANVVRLVKRPEEGTVPRAALFI